MSKLYITSKKRTVSTFRPSERVEGKRHREILPYEAHSRGLYGVLVTTLKEGGHNNHNGLSGPPFARLLKRALLALGGVVGHPGGLLVRVQLRPHGLNARRLLRPRSVRHGLPVPGLRLGSRKEDRGRWKWWQVLPAFQKYEVQFDSWN